MAAARGHPPRHQHAYGRRHPARLGAPRRRSAALRHPLVRRRRRAARHGRRAPARSGAGHRSAALGGAVGMGHARLRTCAARWRARISATPAASTPRRYAQPSARWRPRDASGSRLRRSRAPSACGRPPTCATASRCSRSACRSTASISRRRTCCSRWRTRFMPATRTSTPTASGTRRPFWSTRAWR